MTFRIGPDFMEIYEEEHGPACEVCGCKMERVECDQCSGEGYWGYDCGEDTCCCLDPEDNEECEQCDGEGYWWVCPLARHHHTEK